MTLEANAYSYTHEAKYTHEASDSSLTHDAIEELLTLEAKYFSVTSMMDENHQREEPHGLRWRRCRAGTGQAPTAGM